MRRTINQSIRCLGLLIILLPLVSNSQQQPRVLTLDEPIDLQVQKASLMHVLGWLSVVKRIPIGIEFSAVEKNEPKLNIDVKKASLLKVLNLIVQQEPAYVWELTDGVINFTPVQNREDFFVKLLETPIRSFESPKGNNKFAIRDALLSLPEVNELIRQNGLAADTMDYPHKPSIYANSADLSDRNTNFRSLLNKVIRESEHNSWTLQWFDKKGKVFVLGF